MKRILVLLFFVSSVGYSQTLTQQNDSLIRRQIFNPIRHAQMFKAVIDSLDGIGISQVMDSITNAVDSLRAFPSGSTGSMYYTADGTTPLATSNLLLTETGVNVQMDNYSGGFDWNAWGGDLNFNTSSGSINMQSIAGDVFIYGVDRVDIEAIDSLYLEGINRVDITTYGGMKLFANDSILFDAPEIRMEHIKADPAETWAVTIDDDGVLGSQVIGAAGMTNPLTTTGDIIQSSSGTTPARLASVSTGNVLLSGGVATVNSWGKVGLSTHVSGTLPVANGGTGTYGAELKLEQ